MTVRRYHWFAKLAMLLAIGLNLGLSGFGQWLDGAARPIEDRVAMVVVVVGVAIYGVALAWRLPRIESSGWRVIAWAGIVAIACVSATLTFGSFNHFRASAVEAQQTETSARDELAAAVAVQRETVADLRRSLAALEASKASAETDRQAEAQSGRGPRWQAATDRVDALTVQIAEARGILSAELDMLRDLQGRAIAPETLSTAAQIAQAMPAEIYEIRVILLVILIEFCVYAGPSLFGQRVRVEDQEQRDAELEALRAEAAKWRALDWEARHLYGGITDTSQAARTLSSAGRSERRRRDRRDAIADGAAARKNGFEFEPNLVADPIAPGVKKIVEGEETAA